MILLGVSLLWTLCAIAVERLPQPQQMLPGLALLLVALALVVMIVLNVAWWAGLIATGFVASFYAKPLQQWRTAGRAS